MFIDDLLFEFTPQQLSDPEAGGTPLVNRLRALHGEQLVRSARYDINNIQVMPRDKRENLIAIAEKAPMYPPYDVLWLEWRPRSLNALRSAQLVVWSEKERSYHVTRFEEQATNGAFTFAEFYCGSIAPPSDFDWSKSRIWRESHVRDDENSAAISQGAMVTVSFVLALLNWDREIIPLDRVSMEAANRKRAQNGKHSLSEPTIIRVDKLSEVRYLNPSDSTHDSPLYHPVCGHLRCVSPERPLFGVKPVPGKTCGMLRIRPHFRGNPEKGIKETPLYALTTAEHGDCEICGREADLVSDHNHKTNEWRGRICGPCNTALGMLKDSSKNLAEAIKYLQKYGSENA